MPGATSGRLNGAGFTTIELIVMISIAGILAAFAVARFVDPGGFSSRGFYDEAKSVVRFAQKTAVAWRRPIFVCVASNSIRASTVTGCGTPLANPATDGLLIANAPSGVTLSLVPEFSFDGLGRPSATTTIVLTSTIAGDPARQIVVEAETGYVHP